VRVRAVAVAAGVLAVDQRKKSDLDLLTVGRPFTLSIARSKTSELQRITRDPQVPGRMLIVVGATREHPVAAVGVEVENERQVERSAMLAAFQRREPSAVRAMYRDYGRLVYSVAHRVLGRHDLAEDATQQTFVNAWRAADRIDVDRDPTSWLATIAKRAAIDIHRREARRPTTALGDVAANDRAVVSLPPDLETLDSVWQVRKAIDGLSPDEATIVRLQHLEGMTHAQISEQLGLALGTVKSRSHRAHRHLADALEHLRNPTDG
jgi:RNA polymerase sigma factor (sigma-70 family)